MMFFILLAFTPFSFIRYWCKKKTAAARLRDLRAHQYDPALAEGAAPVEGRHDELEPVFITLPSEVWVSPQARDTTLRRHVAPCP